MDEGQQNQKVALIKEKVKERPLNRKRLVKRTIVTASMAVIFGLIACVTFLVLEPVFSNLLYPEEEPEQVQLKEESAGEEMRPEDMLLEETQESAEEAPQTVVEKVELEMGDLQRLYRLMYAKSQEISNQSLVTVTSVTSDVDWFDNTYENNGQCAGLIVADNGKELLILAGGGTVSRADHLRVTFSDHTQAEAQVKGADRETGLAIVSVSLEEIGEETQGMLQAAVLGGSGNSLLAAPVIAVGRPLGSARSVAYGMITSTETYASFEDSNVRVLTTDIAADGGGSGVLINLSGQVVGILCSGGKKGEESRRVLTAYGISDVRAVVEKLMNGQEIAHMGVFGTDVPEEIHEELGVPYGAYVTGINMDTPAMVAGIQSGDVIVKVGTVEIASFAEYQAAVLNLTPETGITVTILRQGPEGYQEMAVDIILGR